MFRSLYCSYFSEIKNNRKKLKIMGATNILNPVKKIDGRRWMGRRRKRRRRRTRVRGTVLAA